jgi:hypothetical protein
MAIPLTCDCGRFLRIKDELAGRKVRCPECRDILTVPEPDWAREGEEELLDALPAEPARRESRRRSAIQTQPSWRETEAESSVLTAEPPPPRPRSRPLPERERPRREPRVVVEQGWFGNTNAGVLGGLLMILIAIVWFVGGLMVGYIFFYPPVLLVIGIIAFVKGLTDGN